MPSRAGGSRGCRPSSAAILNTSRAVRAAEVSTLARVASRCREQLAHRGGQGRQRGQAGLRSLEAFGQLLDLSLQRVERAVIGARRLRGLEAQAELADEMLELTRVGRPVQRTLVERQRLVEAPGHQVEPRLDLLEMGGRTADHGRARPRSRRSRPACRNQGRPGRDGDRSARREPRPDARCARSASAARPSSSPWCAALPSGAVGDRGRRHRLRTGRRPCRRCGAAPLPDRRSSRADRGVAENGGGRRRRPRRDAGRSRGCHARARSPPSRPRSRSRSPARRSSRAEPSPRAFVPWRRARRARRRARRRALRDAPGGRGSRHDGYRRPWRRGSPSRRAATRSWLRRRPGAARWRPTKAPPDGRPVPRASAGAARCRRWHRRGCGARRAARPGQRPTRRRTREGRRRRAAVPHRGSC